MTRKSFLQIARTLPLHSRGGLETHAWELALAMQRRGWDVDVLTTSFEDRDFVKELEGVRIHHLRYLPLNRDQIPRWRWWQRFAERVRRYAVAQRLRPDVAHSESYHGYRLFRTLQRKHPSARRIMTIHGTHRWDYERSARPRLLSRHPAWHWRALGQALYVRGRVREERRLAYPTADRIVAVQDALADHLIRDYRVPRARVAVIGNGVRPPYRPNDRSQLRAELGVPKDARIVLFVGRLEQSKRVDELLAHLPRRPHDRLLVVGDGPEFAPLLGATERLSNPAAARFLGPVSDEVKARLFAAADVFALPSEAEGEPITILEALAAGTPVYTRRPWVPSDLAPLVATGDDVTAGLDAAQALTERVRSEAHRVSREHSWDAVAARYEDLIRGIPR